MDNRVSRESNATKSILIVLAVLGAGLILAYLVSATAPDRAQVTPDPQNQVSAPTGASPAVPAGTQRFAIVPGQSTATYRVDETLFREGNKIQTAVGTTSAVRGEVIVNRAQPSQSRIGPVTVDISQFKSDRERRDNAIRERWLESAKYPMAQFTVTSIKGLPAAYQDGREIPVEFTGNLKVRDITRPVTWVGTIKLDGDRLTVTGNTTIKMTDFGFDPPAILFLKTENEALLEFRLIATRQE
jgi:polyisoprenoid-binding protein YceI